MSSSAGDTTTQSDAAINVMREVSVGINEVFLTDDWWQFTIRRVTGLGDGYVDPLFVHAVSITYEAHL